MKTVLFIDEVCPKPYDWNMLQTEGMGGTEATVLRISQALPKDIYNVTIEQRGRSSVAVYPTKDVGYSYPKFVVNAQYVVCLRSPYSLIDARKRFPQAKLYLWCHDLASKDLGQALQVIIDTKATLIAVSDWHRGQTIEVLKAFGYRGQFKTIRIYNPVDNALYETKTPRYDPFKDSKKLVWCSSPHKGLDYARELVSRLRLIDSSFVFNTCNPGYMADGLPNPSLPHHAVMGLMSDALCLFYPNVVFPETFGLVFAEANALGVPVLTHPHGAAKEILDHPYETLDCHDAKAVIERVISWSKGARPIVRGKPQFRTSEVIKDWIRILQ